MKFCISFLPDVVKDPHLPENISLGVIKIGSFQEKFEICLDHWSQSEYQEQWSSSIQRLINKKIPSELIISFLNEQTMTRWVMYPETDFVYFKKETASGRFIRPLDGRDRKLSLTLSDLEDFIKPTTNPNFKDN